MILAWTQSLFLLGYNVGRGKVAALFLFLSESIHEVILKLSLT